MSNFDERLIESFSTVFPNLSRDEILRASTASVADWDSLATVTLVSILEEEFGISITSEDFAYMMSFDLVRENIKDKIANA